METLLILYCKQWCSGRILSRKISYKLIIIYFYNDCTFFFIYAEFFKTNHLGGGLCVFVLAVFILFSFSCFENFWRCRTYFSLYLTIKALYFLSMPDKLKKSLESNYISTIRLVYRIRSIYFKTWGFVCPLFNYAPQLMAIKFQYNYLKLGG